jgi:hypothetical protein
MTRTGAAIADATSSTVNLGDFTATILQGFQKIQIDVAA